MFDSEGALVDKFLNCLRTVSPWGKVMTGVEFFYQRGRTDIVAVDDSGCVIAFEAKLVKWREALQQAYRNTCFAHRSYVVLPKNTALLAHRYSAEFALRDIGICYIWQDGVIVLQEAGKADPLQPWLAHQAISWVTASEGICPKSH
jgi:hypothetical protein